MIKKSAVPYLLIVFIAFASCKAKYAAFKHLPVIKQKVLQLKAGADNPRNSEGAFITLKNGNLLFVYSRYTGNSSSDNAPAYLASRLSADDGKTWSTADQVVMERGQAMNIMSVSLLRLQNGDIALFYLRKTSAVSCIPMMCLSKDEAQTWGTPHSCVGDKDGYFVVNNDRVIQLKNGRLLLATALHPSQNGKIKSKAALWSYYSDDNGLTWQKGNEVPAPESLVTQEPGIVELKNGIVMMFIRTDGGAQYLSYSNNKGISWSAAQKSNIYSPLSPASIKRIPATGDLLLVWNDNDGSQPKTNGKRTPLHTAISADEGKTWQHIKSIEADVDGWYCYTAIHFTGNDVLLAYCAGDNKHRLQQTDITRFSLSWLYSD